MGRGRQGPKFKPQHCLPAKNNLRLGTVAQSCNASYLGGRDPEDYDLRPAGGGEGKEGEQFTRPQLSGWMQRHMPVIPATQRSTNRRMAVQVGPGIE
jgi:hypothetical protein